MKAPTTPSILAVAALSSCAYAAVTMSIAKNPEAMPKIRRRQLLSRAAITESLSNNVTGAEYTAQVSVGTPAQTQMLLIDTGSSDVWMLAASSDLCSDTEEQDYLGTGGCTSTFDPMKSSTYKVVDEGGFAITYADGTGAAGDYITDTLTIGGATIKALEMGLASNSTIPMGILGIGYDINEASNSEESEANSFTYPSIIDTMVSQGLISTKAYSLYLDDLEASTGSIIFGGLDSDKYHGDLLQLPIVPDTLQNQTKVYAEFSVAMTGFGVTSQSGTTTNFTTQVEAAILDSGTPVTYLPDRLVDQLVQDINAVDDSEGTGNIFVDCNMRSNASMTFNYGFGGANGVVIKVPVSELVFDLTGAFSLGPYPPPELPFSNACAFGILPGGTEGPFILGDTFLRSAYVVYDIQNNLIALAQTNFNSTTSSVVDFKAGATSIPNVSGVASSAQVTQTATGVIGPQKSATETGSRTTSTGTATGTSTGSTTTGSSATQTQSKSAAVGSVPAFNVQRLLVLGISVAFAGLGG